VAKKKDPDCPRCAGFTINFREDYKRLCAACVEDILSSMMDDAVDRAKEAGE
jgi:hypothetical protein